MKLNNNFYSEESIKNTLVAFSNVCNVSYQRKEGYFEIMITPKIECEVTRVEKEFSNYCLSLMK